MYQVYQGKNNSIFSSKNLPLEGEHVYFIRIGDERIFKIGTTNDLLRRMKEHLRYFKKNIYILWVSPSYTKYTTLRIEDKMKKLWRENTDFKYIPKDRFLIPSEYNNITIIVKKEYLIEI